MRRALVLGLLLGLLLVRGQAHAHGMRTAYLELSEGDGGTVLATWRTTVPAPGVRPRLPEGCEVLGDSSAADGTTVRTFSIVSDLESCAATAAGVGFPGAFSAQAAACSEQPMAMEIRPARGIRAIAPPLPKMVRYAVTCADSFPPR